MAEERIRVILVSTEWHELLVPFSEYVRIADYPISGYQLEVYSSGEAKKTTPVQPGPTSEERKICPSHMIYLFASAGGRDRGTPQIASAIFEAGISDFCIVELDSSVREIPYPYASYAAMDAIASSERSLFAERLLIDLRAEEFDENPWFLEDSVWAKINSRASCVDNMEIGYPEKFSAVLLSWEIRRIYRSGRFSTVEVMPDDVIIEELVGLTGSHPAAFRAVASPKFRLAWTDTLQRAQVCMAPNAMLKSAFDWYTRDVTCPEATVMVSIFNPANIMASLYAFATRADPSYFPSFEIVVSQGEKVRILEGFLKWDGTTPEDPEKLASRIERDPWNFFFLWTSGGLAEYDSRLMRAHGLALAFVETTLNAGGEPVYRWVRKSKGSWKVTSELRPSEVLTIGDFVMSNPAYLLKLVAFVGSNVIEVP